MVANNLLMQFQADILGVPVQRPVVRETTALGAAYLAGLAVGFWRDQAELAGTGRSTASSTPAMPAEQRDRLYAGWKKAISAPASGKTPEDKLRRYSSSSFAASKSISTSGSAEADGSLGMVQPR